MLPYLLIMGGAMGLWYYMMRSAGGGAGGYDAGGAGGGVAWISGTSFWGEGATESVGLSLLVL